MIEDNKSATMPGVEAEPISYNGPYVYENWKAAQAGVTPKRGFEFPLFTDAWILGEISFGPYQLLNTISPASIRHHSPAIVLRLDDYLQPEPPPMNRTDVERYHGGGQGDEIAALLALCLGIRLKSGGYTRTFDPMGDPKGHPMELFAGENPVLFSTTGHAPLLPRALGQHRLDAATLVSEFANLGPQDAMVLVRASRMYQDAVWLAESQPELAWLMLVSAVETAAGHWRSSKTSPEDQVRDSRPGLEKLLLAKGGKELLSEVAAQIADYMGATKKFVDFLLEFLPDAPAERPPEHVQHPWDQGSMKKSLRTIYQWRSRALHGGTPIPLPMCLPPMIPFAEKPLGLAMGTQGGVWVAKDIPMLLHTFEYVVRGSLVKWWKSMQ